MIIVNLFFMPRQKKDYLPLIRAAKTHAEKSKLFGLYAAQQKLKGPHRAAARLKLVGAAVRKGKAAVAKPPASDAAIKKKISAAEAWLKANRAKVHTKAYANRVARLKELIGKLGSAPKKTLARFPHVRGPQPISSEGPKSEVLPSINDMRRDMNELSLMADMEAKKGLTMNAKTYHNAAEQIRKIIQYRKGAMPKPLPPIPVGRPLSAGPKASMLVVKAADGTELHGTLGAEYLQKHPSAPHHVMYSK